MKIASIILFIFSLNVFSMEKNEWPNLAEIKSTSGRVATNEDVNTGAAVFILEDASGKNKGDAIDILIPQYAIHVDSEIGTKTKVIVVQAEEADGNKYIGAKLVGKNEFMLGLFEEFKLLGVSPP